jgi:hypothetical protein
MEVQVVDQENTRPVSSTVKTATSADGFVESDLMAEILSDAPSCSALHLTSRRVSGLTAPGIVLYTHRYCTTQLS